MRGEDRQQGAMFSYLSPEPRVPGDHPLRAIREIVDAVLGGLSPEFARMYAANGRPSIAPEKLLRALLLQVLYTIRSERLLMEQTRLQPVVPVVCGAEHGRCGVGADGVQQEPGPTAGRGHGQCVFRRRGGEVARERLAQ